MTGATLKTGQKGDGDWALVALIFACALTFCGTPDLHDALISHVHKYPAGVGGGGGPCPHLEEDKCAEWRKGRQDGSHR